MVADSAASPDSKSGSKKSPSAYFVGGTALEGDDWRTLVEAIAVDAYIRHILTSAETRATNLRRETAEYETSRAARGSRTSFWNRTAVRAAHAATVGRRRSGGSVPSPAMERGE